MGHTSHIVKTLVSVELTSVLRLVRATSYNTRACVIAGGSRHSISISSLFQEYKIKHFLHMAALCDITSTDLQHFGAILSSISCHDITSTDLQHFGAILSRYATLHLQTYNILVHFVVYFMSYDQ